MCGDGANDAPPCARRDGDRGVDRHRCRKVGGRHRADQTRTRGIVASVKERPRHLPAHPDLYPELGYKKIVQVLFLAVGLVMTGHALLTPMLMVMIMLTGDLLGMSLTTDNVRPSAMPNVWRIGRLTIAVSSWESPSWSYCNRRSGHRKFGWVSESETPENAGLRGHRVR